MLSAAVFLMTAYFKFKTPAHTSYDLDKVYFNYMDTIARNKLDSIKVQSVIKELWDKDGFNYCGTAGYSGNKIPVINPAPLLQHNLSESQLIMLCQKAGPVLKHFAFIALSHVNFKRAKQLFEQHITDATVLYYECGCIGGASIGINLDFLNTLMYSLTDFEKIHYSQKVKANCDYYTYKSGMEFFNRENILIQQKASPQNMPNDLKPATLY